MISVTFSNESYIRQDYDFATFPNCCLKTRTIIGCEDSLMSFLMLPSSSSSREKGVTYWNTSTPSSTLTPVTFIVHCNHNHRPPCPQEHSSPASAGRSLAAIAQSHRQQSSPEKVHSICSKDVSPTVYIASCSAFQERFGFSFMEPTLYNRESLGTQKKRFLSGIALLPPSYCLNS